MIRKILSLILVVVMILGIVPAFADGENAKKITVYVSMSMYDEFVKDTNGNYMAYVPVNLEGKNEYILDDAFLEFHKLYYPDGEAGYASSESEWGLGVDMLWGDTSYNFGYQVNGGLVSVMGPGHIINNGDYIDAFVYDYTLQSYAKFDVQNKEAYTDKPFDVTLFYASGYDESWNSVFSPCDNAKIIINGEETEVLTDENGKANITFNEKGKYVVSASKQKEVNGEYVSVITAPCMIVEVKQNPAISVIHNIAKYYKKMNFKDAASNLPWIACDMLTYEKLFPESNNILIDEDKKECASLIVEDVAKSDRPGDMAKAILALRALGYDATNIYTKYFEKIDLVSRLNSLVENQDESVTNMYTLPYVMIALSQTDDTFMDFLIDTALNTKESWQNTESGTDALTPMIFALSKYYNENEGVKEIVDETVEILKKEQREDGLIDGFEGYEGASTGLAICALSSLKINSEEIKNSGKSLIDGLLSTQNKDKNGFANAFATEQGFRGLLSWRLSLLDDESGMYDFSQNPMNELNITGVKNCPVIFDVTPNDASVKIEGVNEVSKNTFDLLEGEYTYTVSLSGYVTKTDKINITSDDAINRAPKKVEVSLDKKSSGGGGSRGGRGSSSSITITPPKPLEETELKKDENTENTNKIVFSKDTFLDVKDTDWYYEAVEYVYNNELFSGTDKGFEPNLSMTRAMLVTVLCRLDKANDEEINNPFKDVDDSKWYAKSVKWALKNNIVSGVSDNMFAPDLNITREDAMLILYRFAKNKQKVANSKNENTALLYYDYDKISNYALEAVNYAIDMGIITGRGENTIAPKENITRAEVALILMRFNEVIK